MTDEDIWRLVEPLPHGEQLKLLTDHFNAKTEREKVNNELDKVQSEAVIKFAEISIRSLLLLCGGAAIAFLAFAGNAGKESAMSAVQISGYANAVGIFGIAAACSVLAGGSSYFSQATFHEIESPKLALRIGNVFRLVAILFWLFGVTLFAWGIWTASHAITGSAGKALQVNTPSGCMV